MSFLLGNRFSYEENVYESYDFHVSIEDNGYMDFMMESMQESSLLTQSLYAADSMLESMYHQGVDVEDLVTEAANSFFEKTKQFLEKLWAKIKQWFEKVKRFFQIMFTSGKEFIKKFESDIRTAASNCNGFKYQFYDVKQAKLTKLVEAVNTFANVATNKLKTDAEKIVLTATKIEDDTKKREYTINGKTHVVGVGKSTYTTGGDTHMIDVDEFKKGGNVVNDRQGNPLKKGIKAHDDIVFNSDSAGKQAKDHAKVTAEASYRDVIGKSFENGSELQTLLKEAVLGDSREEFEDFSSGPAYTEMIDWVRDYEKLKKDLDKNETSIKKALDKARGEVNEQYSKFKGDDDGIKILDYIKAYAEAMANYSLNGVEVLKQVRKTLYKDSQSVLKSLLRHKPKTESYSYRGRSNYDEDILEMALRSL